MNRDEMTRIVNEDLKHIPRNRDFDTQAELRATYNALRRHGLTLGKNKDQTLAECIDFLKKQNPSWMPMYDRDYFKL
jgi:hypothetical protein